ncbi:hypothetical protein JMJ77_0000192 [Colletotrichum scovillei]|uniref:Uncharacterized protein n=1 Tax=Colletotrichum scovillei TaxID=1209932 RepID=A0A9P7R8Y6_9PEZI|nr:hypothetical protein JMJ77_0000192 [Colletotrichum scovillei]KAG7071395.1 hypothetical protein JMJ76_0004268 [Colletotrichum scovillei]KAG7079611.1 hypothetical protein JMJ78_0006717 [Colletotrichum scovillei]
MTHSDASVNRWKLEQLKVKRQPEATLLTRFPIKAVGDQALATPLALASNGCDAAVPVSAVRF